METELPLMTTESIAEAQTVFSEVAKLNAAMRDQNDRYNLVSPYADVEKVDSALETETNPERVQELHEKRQALGQKIEEIETAHPKLAVFRSLSREDRSVIVSRMVEGIAKEQQQTFADLADYGIAYGEEVYDEVGLTYLLTNKAQADIQSSIKAHDALMHAQQDKLEAEVEAARSARTQQQSGVLDLVSMLAPLAQDPVKAYLSEHTNVTSEEIQMLESEMYELMRIQDTLKGDAQRVAEQGKRAKALYEEGGNAWTVPWVIFNELGSEAVALAYLDELPVDPEFREPNAAQFESIRRRCVDAPEASINIALYFELHAGQTVTVENLIETLYPNRSLSYNLYRTRVTSLLGPKRGQVPTILASGGYTLQYGWRRYLEKANGRITTKSQHRIYRVMPTDQAELFPEGDTYEAEDGSFADFFKPIAVSEQAQESIPDEASAPVATKEPPKAEQTFQPKPVLSATKEKRGPSKKPRQETWEKDYRITIGETISTLESEGLLTTREGVLVKAARTAGRRGTLGRTFATEETLIRLEQAGLISLGNSNKNTWRDILLTPEQLVMMANFTPGSPTDPLRKDAPRATRERALTLIQDSIEAFFYNKEQANKTS